MRRAILVLSVLALPWAGGCIDFSGKLGARHEQMLRKVEATKKVVQAKADKFNQRDMLRSQLNGLDSEIEQIKAMIGTGSGGKR